MRQLGKYTFRQIYWLFEAGWPKRKMSEMRLLYDGLQHLPPSVFFLSTGRVGTQWFAKLFQTAKKQAITFHEPLPSFIIQNPFFYQLRYSQLDQQTIFEIGRQLLLTGRVEYFIYAYKTQKIYIETNHYLTFFAEVIHQTLPRVKFVHLYRHPGQFIRSAINAGWFQDPLVDNTLIKPNVENWTQLSQLEKNAYLWREVNQYALELREKLGPEKVFQLNFSKATEHDILKLTEFVGVEIPLRTIRRLKAKKVNKSRSYSYPKYEQWPQEDKQKVREICGPVAEKLGINL